MEIIGIKERIVREAKGIGAVFNGEKVLESVKEIVENPEVFEMEDGKKEFYLRKFKEMLEEGRVRKVNFVGLFLGPYWASYRNRPWGALVVLFTTGLLGFFLATILKGMHGVIIQVPLLAFLFLLLALVLQLAPFVYFGLYGYAYLAATKDIPATKSIKGIFIYVIIGVLFSLLLNELGKVIF